MKMDHIRPVRIEEAIVCNTITVSISMVLFMAGCDGREAAPAPGAAPSPQVAELYRELVVVRAELNELNDQVKELREEFDLTHQALRIEGWPVSNVLGDIDGWDRLKVDMELPEVLKLLGPPDLITKIDATKGPYGWWSYRYNYYPTGRWGKHNYDRVGKWGTVTVDREADRAPRVVDWKSP